MFILVYPEFFKKSLDSEAAFLAENKELISKIKQGLQTLCADAAEINEILKNDPNYPASKISEQLSKMLKGILDTRISINELDAAARSKRTSVRELPEFKDALASAHDYFNEATRDFYMLTSGADASEEEALEAKFHFDS